MLRIRMMRFGRKRQPSYRVVVLPRGTGSGRSKYVESLGWVDPLARKNDINKERAQYWLGVGAQPSDTVWNLFVNEGIVEGPKRKKGKAGITKETEEAEEASGTETESGGKQEADSADAAADDGPKEEKEEQGGDKEEKQEGSTDGGDGGDAENGNDTGGDASSAPEGGAEDEQEEKKDE